MEKIGTVLQTFFASRMEEWTGLLIALAIFLGFLLFRNIFTKTVFTRVLRWAGNTGAEWINSLLQAYERPLRIFWVVIGLYLALQYLPNAGWEGFFNKLFRSAVILLIAWGLFNFSGVSSSWLVRLGERYDLQVDRILIPFLSKVLRVLIIALTFTVLAQEWGYRIEGLIAGLGLGGLAISLAAKDTLANLFGGLAIITEKHFTIGDWIQTPSVEGTVEGITFRSTLVRTFDQALVTIPNSVLANEAIKNWSKMGKRRVTYHLGISYLTPREKIQRCVQKIRQMLQEHPEIHPETIFVSFDRFNESSLDIFLYFFTKTTVWGEYLRVKEDCNLRILEILEEEGVNLAFPSRSLYLETSLDIKESGQASGKDTESTGIQNLEQTGAQDPKHHAPEASRRKLFRTD